jgi:hypothetical protein
MFSTRVPADLQPNLLAAACTRLLGDGVPVLDLTDSNPTTAGFDYPTELLSPLADPGGLTYWPEARGLAAARAAVTADYARRGIAIDPARVVLTASTSEAYSLLFKILCDPGDEVLVPRPSYPLFEHLTSLEAVRAVTYDLEPDASWQVDLASLDRAVTGRSRAVLVVSPNNPTGSFLSRPELDAIAERCLASGLALIVDEVFADFVIDDETAADRAVPLREARCLTFGLGGLSKSVGLPQVKLGWVAAGGPDRLVGDALARLEFAADAYLSASTPVQVAAPALLERGAVVRAQIQERLRRNYRALRGLASSRPSLTVLAAEGGWSAIVRVPALASEEEIVLDLLTETGVLVHPGYFFDFPREAYLVVSLLVPEPRFADGVGRVIDRLEHLGRCGVSR